MGKKRLKINNLEHVIIGKVIQLFRNMLWINGQTEGQITLMIADKGLSQ